MEVENYYSRAEYPKVLLAAVQWYFKKLSSRTPGLAKRLYWKLFTTPNRRRLKEKHITFLTSATQTTRTYNNNAIQWYEWGQGEKSVLVIHGWEGMSADFAGIITALSNRGFEVHAMDMPAHGRSQGKRTHMPQFIRTIRHVIDDNEPYHAIIGHSLGAGASAFALTDIHSLKVVNKLVLMGVHPTPYTFFEQIKSLLQVPDDIFELCVQHAIQDVQMDPREMDLYRQCTRVRAKQILVIHDNEDHVSPVNDISRLVDGWPDAQLLRGTHGGHQKHYKHEDVIDGILNFL